MTKKKDPGALAGATGADHDAAGQEPDLFIKSEIAASAVDEASGENRRNGAARHSPASEPEDDPAQASTLDREEEARGHPLPWLANLSPAEYEFSRRRLARERGWRVAFLDRLYREARAKAGQR
jgi:hypothetical protein